MLPEPQASVVYVMPDTLGGVFNIVKHLLDVRVPDDLRYEVVLTRNHVTPPIRSPERLNAAVRYCEYRLPVENLHAVLGRLRDTIGCGPGVLVANDLLELAMLHLHDPGRTVVQLLHGDTDYYYGLSTRHQAVIDVFVAYSRAMVAELQRRLPQRAADVRYLPYGIPLPRRTRTATTGPLRLLFAGRIEHEQKGVFDLPRIDEALASRSVDVRWTIIGDGPDAERLRAQWQSDRVVVLGARTNSETIDRAAEHDVFVLPTRFEGLPVALMEAMAVGLVPVVSDIPSGVPDLVVSGLNGILAPVGDIGAYATAIERLAHDRARLDQLSAAARLTMERQFDATACAAAYQSLYREWPRLRRRSDVVPDLPYGSRLDQPWLPNPVVRTIRSTLRRVSGRPR